MAAVPQDPYVTPSPPEGPVFNTFRWKILRPFYSMGEAMGSLAILLVLAAVLGWVLWRGAHPDPALFAAAELEGASKPPIAIYEQPLQPWVEPGGGAAGGFPEQGGGGPVAGAGSVAGGGLAPFPPGVLSEGWQATGRPEMFDESNLYNKINGRETFYKGFGFRKLHYLSLRSASDRSLTIDIELFDLGSVENAIGALAAEASNPESPPRLEGGGLVYTTRNGGFLSRGRFYARLVGADDAPAIREKITALIPVLRAAFPEEPLPWAYALFSGGMNLPPSGIRFEKENVFSFGFADRFYLARTPDADTEIYVSHRESPGAAAALVERIAKGFEGYGKPVDPAPDGAPAGARFVRNQFIGTVDAVASSGPLVVGVRLAKEPAAAADWLKRLHAAAAGLRLPETVEPASPSASPATVPAEEGYGE